MLKRMFVSPDPGRLRLRGALRAVLGIGLAVTLCGLAGHSLVAAVTGGLAALLALFTVLDTTVRDQALTTALLPVAGFPVLALAAVLHDHPTARGAAFLAVMGLGVYARRWGPRGHSLGVFAFMAFFTTQFLHTLPQQLPELYSAVALSLLASSTVRFGLWCYERRLPTAPVPAPSTGTGLARVTTRQAVQAVAGGAVALVAGLLLSEQRWYWAVGATWWVFVNTTSRGETLVRGFRRVLGTLIGFPVGLAVVVPLHGAPVPSVLLVALGVFGIFYTAAVSYTWMMLSVTLLAGALAAALAVLLVLPVTTHATTDAWIQRALRCVHACTAEAAARLAGSATADPAPRIAELEALLGRVRLSVAPLVHPLSPLRVRRARARQVLALLDACAREVRGLASVAADPEASHDARLTAACWRVEASVEALTAPDPARRADVPGVPPHVTVAEPALAHLHGLERALAELAAPLRSAPGAPPIGA
ncbi:FUSC family protein [Streptomyces sp. NPDC001282]|uniref:FUSC family protein n=1 Tax=Streptomyces sp. NPDC001282 TaxID=3364557 RepID=UPI0036CBAE67